MINTMKLSAKQVTLCQSIIDFFAAKTGENVTEEMKTRWAKGLFRRVELREAHESITGHVACPYFITKNTAAKASKKEGNSLYNVQRFIDFAAKHPPVTEAEKPAKPAKKEAKGKKEASPAKGKKKAVEPAAEPAALLEAPATE